MRNKINAFSQRQLHCRQIVWPPEQTCHHGHISHPMPGFKVLSLGDDSVGWILLFQPGSILHHYINTQCAMTI